MMIEFNLHHFGFIVKDMQKSISHYERLLSASLVGETYKDPVQLADICFLSISPDKPLLEIISPYDQGSQVMNFLKSRGGGLHHVGFSVNSLSTAMAVFRSNHSILVFGPKPAVALGGRDIAFFYTIDHVLIELVQSI